MSEKRSFPAINLNKSGTRREDLLLTKEELKTMYAVRKALSTAQQAEVTEDFISEVMSTKNNAELVERLGKIFKD